MAHDPYQPCPCGSGKKLKWCCQKAIKYVEKAEQLAAKQQWAAAVQALDEGLSQDPKSLWLRTMKANLLLATASYEEGRQLIDEVLADHPGHELALQARLRLELEERAVPEAILTAQQILELHSDGDPALTGGLMLLIGQEAAETHPFAALKHLRFALLTEPQDSPAEQLLSSLEHEARLPPWLKEDWELRVPAPEAVSVETAWREAIECARAGSWAKAAATFRVLASRHPQVADLWLNLGLCQGWMGRNEAAESLHRYAGLEGDPEIAVQAEILAQCLDPRPSQQTVDVVSIRHRIRDHSQLVQSLKDHPRFAAQLLDRSGSELDHEFYVLDKPTLQNPDSDALDDVPLVIGQVRIHGEELELRFLDPVPDDPRPKLLLEAAGEAIDPDGQRQPSDPIPLSAHRMRAVWSLPAGWPPSKVRSVQRGMQQRHFQQVWVDTPLGWLENKTPHEAAREPQLRNSLRAALLILEHTFEAERVCPDLDDLRKTLGCDLEPKFDDPETDVERLPLSRLRQVSAERLSIPRLKPLFERAKRFHLPRATEKAAEAIVNRAADFQRQEVRNGFTALVDLAISSDDRDAALNVIQRARQFDAQSEPSENRTWDIYEWVLAARLEPVTQWAPKLNELMRKCEASGKQASQELASVLFGLGLIRLTPDISQRDRLVLDTRLLDGILQTYGSGRSGGLDLTPAAEETAGKIWTPGTEIVGPQPGSQDAGRSKLWIPDS